MSQSTSNHAGATTDRSPAWLPQADRPLSWAAMSYTLFGIPSDAAPALHHAGRHAILIEAAEFALMTLAAALLVGMLLGLPTLARRLFPATPWRRLPASQLPGEGQEWAELNIRREILDDRLQVDEPRICSARGTPCTCWSFCGGDPDLNKTHHIAAPSNAAEAANVQPHRNDAAIAVIDRSKVTDCPFP